MNIKLKRRFFVATVESILLYGCEAWALKSAMEKALDGSYTRMLRKALNVHWNERMPNVTLYGKLPKPILWEPTHGQRDRGRPRSTYVDQLKRDTGASTSSHREM